MIAEKQRSKHCYFIGEATLDERWRFVIRCLHNSSQWCVFVLKTQINPVKLHVHVCVSDISYFNKIINDRFLIFGVVKHSVKTAFKKIRSQAPCIIVLFWSVLYGGVLYIYIYIYISQITKKYSSWVVLQWVYTCVFVGWAVFQLGAWHRQDGTLFYQDGFHPLLAQGAHHLLPM